MPRSAIEAGAKVAIGWKVTTYDNHMNDWIDYFFMRIYEQDLKRYEDAQEKNK